MKLNKLLQAVLASSALVGTTLAAASLASCGTSKQEDVQSKYFDIENGVLKGFKSSLTEEQKKEAVKDGVLKLPAVKVIGKDAFNETITPAPYAETIEIAADTQTIEDGAFYGNRATNITFTGGVDASDLKWIGKEAFAGCNRLTSFAFPKGLFTDTAGEGIGEAAFFCCENIKTLDLHTFDYTYIRLPNWTRGAFKGLPITDDCKMIFTKPTDSESSREFKLKMYLCAHMYTRLNYNGLGTNWKQYWNDGKAWETQIKAVPEEYLDIQNHVLKGATTEWPNEERGYNTVLVPNNVSELDTGIRAFFLEKSRTGEPGYQSDGIECWLFNWSNITEIPAGACAAISISMEGGKMHPVEAYWPQKITDIPGYKTRGLTIINDDAFNQNEWINDFPAQQEVTTIGANVFSRSALSGWAFGEKTTVSDRAFYDAHLVKTLDFSALTDIPASWTGTYTFTKCGEGTEVNNQAVIKDYDNKVDQWRIRSESQEKLKTLGLTLGSEEAEWSIHPEGKMTKNDLFDITINGTNCTINGWAKGDKRQSGAELTATEVGKILDEIEGVSTAHTLSIPETITVGTTTYKVTGIKANAFFDGTNGKLPSNVTKLSLPVSDNFTTIGDYAFKANTSLLEVSIPNNVTSMGDSAFANCSSLAKIDLTSFEQSKEGSKAPKWGTKLAFSGISSKGVISVKDYSNQLDQWRLNYFLKDVLTNNAIKFAADKWKFDNEDSATLVTIETKDNVKTVTGWATGTDGKITDTEKQYLAADKGYTNTLQIPAEAEAIADNAFAATSKEGVIRSTIPTTLSTIAFENKSQCTSIGAHAFDGAWQGHTATANPLVIDLSKATNLESIGEGAFYGTKVHKVVMPKTDAGSLTFGLGVFSGSTTLSVIDLTAYGTTTPTDWLGSKRIFDGIATTGKILVTSPGTTFKFFLKDYSNTILANIDSWEEATTE